MFQLVPPAPCSHGECVTRLRQPPLPGSPCAAATHDPACRCLPADVRLAAFSVDADVVFWSISTVALALFVTEFTVFSIGKPGYLFSFYFWLDLVATLSLIPDIGWIWNPLTNSDDSSDVGSADEVRAGRAARAGTRAGRVVRIVRLIRLVRIVKLYKQFVASLKSDEGTGSAQVVPMGSENGRFVLGGGDSAVRGAAAGSAVASSAVGSQEPPPAGGSSSSPSSGPAPVSKVGTALSDMTTRQVILLILLMLFVVPFLDSADISIESTVQGENLVALHLMPQTDAANVSASAFRASVETYARYTGRVAFMSVCDVDTECRYTWADETLHGWLRQLRFAEGGSGEPPAEGEPGVDTISVNNWSADLLHDSLADARSKLRTSERSEYSYTDCFEPDGTRSENRTGCVTTVVFDNRHITVTEALLSIGKTFFVILVIGAGSMMFTQNAERLVIRPIERMSRLMQALAKDPLRSIDAIREEVRLAELEEDERAELEEEEHRQHLSELRRRASTSSLSKSGFKSMKAVDWSSSKGSGKLGVPGKEEAPPKPMKGIAEASPEAGTGEGEGCLAIVQHKGSQAASSLASCISGGKKNAADSYETALLENTMLKIGGLLQVGFGQAGGEIIRKNMHGAKDGKLNPLVKGSKIDAVYGFCDIRQFTDTTECLQEDVMVFVNQIGQIVHSSTHRLEGAANKNIGDAFLLTWKLPRVSSRKHKVADPTATNRRGARAGDAKAASPRVVPHPGTSLDSPALDSSPALGTPKLLPPISGGEEGSTTVPPPLRVPTPSDEEEAEEGGWMPEASSMVEVLGEFVPGFRSAEVPEHPGKQLTIVVAVVEPQDVPDLDTITTSPASRAGAESTALAAEAGDAKDSSVAGRETWASSPPRHPRGRGTPLGSRMNVSVRRGSAVILTPMSASEMGVDVASVSSKSSAPGTGEGEEAGEDSSSAAVSGRAASPSPAEPPFGGASPPPKGQRAGSLDTSAAAGIAASSAAGAPPGGEGAPPPAATPGKGHRASMPALSAGRQRLLPASPSASVGGMSPVRRGSSMGRRPSSIRRTTTSMSHGHNPHVLSRLADNALAAFLKMMVDIHNSNERGPLNKYRHDPRIIARMGEGYGVRMGYGLHIGWAIEGAIGSAYKVDASYLSPNVNLASRLEAATKQYGVPLLISREFAQELSPAAQKYLRLLDRVTVKGSKHPMELYTFDVSFIPEQFGDAQHNIEPRTAKERKALKTAPEPPIHVDFASDPAVLALQAGLPDDFFECFEAGVQAYLEGDWPTSRRHLQEVLDHWKPEDGPSKTLLRVMERMGQPNGAAPADWQGFRALTEK